MHRTAALPLFATMLDCGRRLIILPLYRAGWMLAALLFTCAWWIGLWDLHAVKSWDIGSIAFYFSMAAGIYLNARLVSPRIPESARSTCNAFIPRKAENTLSPTQFFA